MQIKDSYAGFRSDFVHFSISVTSPLPPESHGDPDLDACSRWPGIPKRDRGRAAQNNSFHFAPGVMAQFWDNWRLFDSTMSLPIRQGQLFPSPQPPSKKFGRHTATIKYRLDIAPLYIAHTYKQDVKADWSRGVTTILGVKGRVDHLRLDLHQRATEETIERKERKDSVKVVHKRFYEAEIDADGIEMRVLHGTFSDPLKAQVAPTVWTDADAPEIARPPPMPSSDRQKWIDEDDYVDVHWHPERVGRLGDFNDRTAPTVSEPIYRTQPFLTCPRITYYKRPVADPSVHKPGGANAEEADESSAPYSKFGDEPTHVCLIGHAEGALEDVERRSDARRARHCPGLARRQSDRTAQARARIEGCEWLD